VPTCKGCINILREVSLLSAHNFDNELCTDCRVQWDQWGFVHMAGHHLVTLGDRYNDQLGDGVLTLNWGLESMIREGLVTMDDVSGEIVVVDQTNFALAPAGAVFGPVPVRP